MPNTRILLLCLLISSFASPLTAEQNAVTLGKYKVHPTRIIARHAPGVVVPQSTTATLQSLGLTVIRRYTQVPGLIVLDSSKKVALADLPDPKTQAEQLVARIVALQNSGLFAYVEADYVVTNCVFPTDAAFNDGTLWGLINVGQDGGTPGADIAASTAWNLTRGSTNVIVAVIDTGIRYTHQDLATQMWHNPDEVAGNGLDDDNDGYTDNVFGINAITGSGDPFDDNDHGTHVAGTIGAAANNGHPHVGVAWNVSLMACKFLDSQGFGFTSDAISCIDFAVKKGARILNNSWGGRPFEQSLFDAIADARSKGALFVAAAGNKSENDDVIPFYPGSYDLDNVISVAALDRRDQLADFSSYGKNRVHLGAPGVEIFSTTAGSDSSYDFHDGTSMAAPHVSGVAALILARFTNAPMVEIRERILSTVVPVPALSGITRTGGRVNAFRALSATADGILEVYVDPPTGSDLLAGSSNTIFATVSDLLPIRNATVTVEGNTNIVFQNTGKPPDLVSNDNIYSSIFKVPTNVGPLTLKIIASAAGKTNGTNIVVYNVIERPPNDNFADAAKVPTGGAFGATLIQATNKLATIEAGEPIHEGIPSRAASVWWDWSPKTSGRTLVDTAGSSFDTLLGVYIGADVTSLATVASGEDPPGKSQSTLHFTATNGITYHVAVAGAAADQTGTIRLRIELGGEQDTNAPIVRILSPPSGLIITNAADNKIIVAGTALDLQPNASGVKQVLVQVNEEIASGAFGTTNWVSTNVLQFGENTIRVIASDFAENISAPETIHVNYHPLDPVNDTFLRAIDLAGSAGSVKVSNTNATKEFQEPFHGGNDGGKSVWWRFRSPADGVLFLSTTNSTFDTLLGLYTGDRVNALTTIAGNDDAFDGSQFSKVTQAIHGNQTYYIAVDGYGGRSGSINLDYAFTPTNIFKLTVSSTAGGTVTPSSGMVENNATIVLSAIPDQNFEFDRWEGSVTSSANPLSIVITSDVALTARFKPKVYSDDFETGSFNRLPYTFSGDAPWLVERTSTTPDNFAARSGSITNNQRSSLLLNTTSGLGGAASFDFKVGSEKNWDFLEFYVNGTRQQRWSGDVGWLTYQFTLPQGQNALEWRYIKDSTISAGLDAAFIDNLLLPSENSGNVIQARLAMAHVQSGRVQIRVDGEPNQQYIIEASSDLVSWEPISTNVAAQGLIKFVDENSTKYPQRFYRVIAR